MTKQEENISLGEISQQLQDLTRGMKTMQESVTPLVRLTTKLEEIVEAYDSVLFGKKFLAGLAVIVTSVVAIGGAIIWVINYIRHGS